MWLASTVHIQVHSQAGARLQELVPIGNHQAAHAQRLPAAAARDKRRQGRLGSGLRLRLRCRRVAHRHLRLGRPHPLRWHRRRRPRRRLPNGRHRRQIRRCWIRCRHSGGCHTACPDRRRGSGGSEVGGRGAAAAPLDAVAVAGGAAVGGRGRQGGVRRSLGAVLLAVAAQLLRSRRVRVIYLQWRVSQNVGTESD